MIEINEDSFLTKPYPYQYDGVKHILTRPYAAVFDEMGVGKTKQTIDAASILFENGEIDTVVVVCPASVRGVWDNAETGEIAKHCRSDYAIIRFDKTFNRTSLPETPNTLLWVTVSYSFLRARKDQFFKLFKKSNRKIFVVYDESSYIANFKSQQSRACKELAEFAKRRVILNGTPMGNNIIDYWSQFNILDPEALGHMNYYHFRARYCLMGGFEGKQILNLLEEEKECLRRIQNPRHDLDKQQAEFKLEKILEIKDKIERLKEKLKPWVIRREKKDVLKDLPPKLPPVFLEAPLTQDGYRVYKEMAEEMVAWANESEYSSAVNGAVKLGRLSQITSGFLGGIAQLEECEDYALEDSEKNLVSSEPKEVDDSKLKTFLEWYADNRHLQVVVWCRFRTEMFRLQRELEAIGVKTGLIIGKQSDTIRQSVIHGFQKKEIDVVIANPRSGGWGINLTASHTAVYLSLTHSLIAYQQSSDRLHRNGQTMPVSYIFILATTPDGKPTVDHLIVKAVLNKEDMAKWSMDKWRTVVMNL